MSKLTKKEIRNHEKALKVLEQDILSDDDKIYVFKHYHEAATNMNSKAGAFFTPLPLAWDFALVAGGTGSYKGSFVDLCSGIGVLAYSLVKRYPMAKVTCIEINQEYVNVGKKLVPEADWHCLSLSNVLEIKALGPFDIAVSNPPYGYVDTFKDVKCVRYTGSHAEYKTLDIAACIASEAVFIMPIESAGFVFSGPGVYREHRTKKYLAMVEEMGMHLEVSSLGLDTAFYMDEENWKGGLKISVEITCMYELPNVKHVFKDDVLQTDLFELL